MIDSGAYSAWRSGAIINLDDYCTFLHVNAGWIGDYVALDVINPQDPEAAAAQSFMNLLQMRRAGLDPIPVYHVGEKIDWLYKMLDLGCRYIGLSASSITARGQVDRWYDLIWTRLVNSGGYPTVKVHAFGEGREASILRYPWHSVDSASWLYFSDLTGSCLVPGKRRVFFRNDNKSRRNAPDVEALGELDLADFKAFLDSIGLDYAALAGRDRVAGTARLYITACYFKWLEDKASDKCPVRLPPQGLLFQGRQAPAINVPQMNLHLVAGGNTRAWIAIALAGAKNVLASYWHIVCKSHYENLSAFVFDPLPTLRRVEPFATHFALLETYLNANLRVEGRAQRLQTAEQQACPIAALPDAGVGA